MLLTRGLLKHTSLPACKGLSLFHTLSPVRLLSLDTPVPAPLPAVLVIGPRPLRQRITHGYFPFIIIIPISRDHLVQVTAQQSFCYNLLPRFSSPRGKLYICLGHHWQFDTEAPVSTRTSTFLSPSNTLLVKSGPSFSKRYTCAFLLPVCSLPSSRFLDNRDGLQFLPRGPPGWGRARMTLFSRTSNPFLPSIRVRVVPFGVVHLSPARTVYGLPLPYTTKSCARTRHKSCSSAPMTLVASIVCRRVAGPMSTILASPTHQPISTRCGLVKSMTQIPVSPIGNCLSLPVLFHLFFLVPYPDTLPVLLFHHYLGPSYSIPESFAGPSSLYGCIPADSHPPPFRTSPM
ncbi:unnamed protein product [Acanthosepion pharaonis]|uniref:Uncharacterized protein n=1 Tax=Acanthosepion pharaonis TaxID=158019 RepID=A0A812B6V9_ACAPH|nr:unnamed protein product [Sepia pharaonis]